MYKAWTKSGKSFPTNFKPRAGKVYPDSILNGKGSGSAKPTSAPKPKGKKIKPRMGKGNAATANLKAAMAKLAGDNDNPNG